MGLGKVGLWIKKEKIKKESIILIVLLILMIPFSLNSPYFISNGVSHELMIFAMFLCYVFLLKLGEAKDEKKNKEDINGYQYTVGGLISILIISSILYSNNVYLKKELDLESTKLTLNRIINSIEQTSKYEVGITPVAFVGDINESNLSQTRKEIDYKGVGLYSNFSITYYKTYNNYFKYYLNYPINIVEEEKMIKLSEKKEVEEMPPFPSKGYIKMIDGVLVVKVS